MVTDILRKGTQLYASGERSALERAFGDRGATASSTCPGVMSRKKQVAPKLLAALPQAARRRRVRFGRRGGDRAAT